MPSRSESIKSEMRKGSVNVPTDTDLYARVKAEAISARNKPDVEKASFGSRSEAGRYAANVRWKGHEKVESPSTPRSNINRAVGQIVSRLGLIKGDKFGTTHGWNLDTRNNRTIVSWTNRYGDNAESTVKRIADALTSKGYETSVSGNKIEVTQSPKARTKPDNYAQVVQEIIDEERQMRDPTPTVKPQGEQVESPSQRVLETVSATMKLGGEPFPKKETGKNNYYLLLRNHGANHKDAMKEANADDLERKANPRRHAIKDKARKELLQEILDAKGTPLTVSSHWDMPYN